MVRNVSIVTVNYNGFAVTCDLIDSLFRYNYGVCQIIVVDNGSIENEADLLQKKYPDIEAIRSNENLGFAGGNNLGICSAKGEYILLLNNDVTVTEHFLEPMISRFAENSEIGVVCPKIMFEYSPDRIQFAGYTPLHSITLRNRLIGHNEVDKGQHDKSGETPYALGAAFLLKRDILDRVGGMPEVYFLYYEELDWCLHIRKAGFTIWYESGAKVYHKESATAGRLGPLKQYYITRNRILFAKRNLRGHIFVLSVLFQVCLSLPKHSVSFLLKRRMDLFGATWKGVLHGFKLIIGYDATYN